jgi:hypothetical protein
MCPIWKNFVARGAALPENFHMSHLVWEVAKTKISAGLSRITPPAQLNEMVQ